jgi:hypothetical protein
MGGDVVDELAEGAGGEFPAVPAAGFGVDAGSDEAEHGGERDQVRVDAGQGGGAGRNGGDHVVHEEECRGFLPGQDHGLAAQDTAGAAERFLQVQESGSVTSTTRRAGSPKIRNQPNPAAPPALYARSRTPRHSG